MSLTEILHHGIYPVPLPLDPLPVDISGVVMVACFALVSIVYTITYKALS